MYRRVANSARATSGTLIRNAARQLTVSTSRPPTTGPMRLVADVAEAQMPNARARASPSNSAVRIASEPGTSRAPAAPCISRNTTSSSSVGARPHRTDAIPKPTRPIVKIFRRPW